MALHYRRPYDGAMPPSTLFEDAIDIPIWLEADRTQAFAERMRRDRAIGRDLVSRDTLAMVRAWWSVVRSGEPGLGRKLIHARQLIGIIVTLLGLMTGALMAVGALHYDGSQPVNVVTAFAVLVALQWLLLALTLLLLLPALPGLRAVQAAIGQLNPAVIAAALYRRLSGAELPRTVQSLFAWHIGRAAASRFSKWQVLRWSQSAAIAFNVGAITTAVFLIALTDLAFGWSTTLRISAADAASFTTAVSWPWHQLAPSAVPSAELIDGSRFFRLEHSGARLGPPEAYLGWWQFLLTSMLCYGLLPRVVIWLLSGIRLASATRALLLEDAEVTALRDRMAAESVTSAADSPERPRKLPDVPPAVPRARAHGAAAALIWAEAITDTDAIRHARNVLGIDIASDPQPLGGGATLADDRASLEHIGQLAPRQVVVFVRAYEPPLLDLLDALVELRRRLGTDASIVVAPIPERDVALDAGDVDTWRRTVATLRDAHLYVETGT